MYKIAFCDDEIETLEQISALFERYRTEKHIQLEDSPFQSASSLLDAMHAQRFDAVLLDVRMSGIDGMQAARELRGFDDRVKLIFLTASPEFAVESYAVDAYYYLLKPLSAEKLFPLLDRLVADFDVKAETLCLKTGGCVVSIPLDTLEYVEVQGKQLSFYLTDGSVRNAPGPLSEFEPQLLGNSSFLKVHRSYVVNLWHMTELSADGFVTRSAKSIPVSRLLYARVRTTYLQHLFVEKGGQ